jgi:hypothetical protein
MTSKPEGAFVLRIGPSGRVARNRWLFVYRIFYVFLGLNVYAPSLFFESPDNCIPLPDRAYFAVNCFLLTSRRTASAYGDKGNSTTRQYTEPVSGFVHAAGKT